MVNASMRNLETCYFNKCASHVIRYNHTDEIGRVLHSAFRGLDIRHVEGHSLLDMCTLARQGHLL
jgi:hypothetical protein